MSTTIKRRKRVEEEAKVAKEGIILDPEEELIRVSHNEDFPDRQFSPEGWNAFASGKRFFGPMNTAEAYRKGWLKRGNQ